jgi:hypothetical protein
MVEDTPVTVILAIDPGPTESAWVLYDDVFKTPLRWAKELNIVLRQSLPASDRMAVEMIASYGMPVGAEVFDTCVWIGRLVERHLEHGGGFKLVYRRDVKLHLCGDSRAKDANIRQALIDKWGGKEAAIGRKAAPGPLYGITGDCWAALGVAVTAAETEKVL